MNMQSRST